MDPNLWRAAQSCNWEAIAPFSADFDKQRTANGNTLLHVMVQSPERGTAAVKQILATRPDLAFQRNSQRETPLILAARRGFSEVVRAIIDSVKNAKDGRSRLSKMLGAADLYENTALHVAVRNNHYDVVAELLLEELLPSSSYKGNYSGESPLYVAVEKGNVEIAKLILRTCKSPCYDGPEGKTSLHAAALSNCAESMELLLEKMLPGTIKKVDAFGWTALHYAVKFNHVEMVKLLLSKTRSLGYIADRTDGFKTALHIAVMAGHLRVVKEILSHCPDSWELTTSKRQNVIHTAVENEQKEVLDFLLNRPWASELINRNDIDGNTPLHLYAATKHLLGYNLVTHPSLNRNAFNKDHKNPLDRLLRAADNIEGVRENSIKEELVEAGVTPGLRLWHETKPEENKIILVVAALITTVTFGCAFTIPGGFDNKGMAVQSKKAAFIAFILSDSWAMWVSAMAVITGLDQDIQTLPGFEETQMYFTTCMAMMVLAFCTGLYVILPKGVLSICLLVGGSIYSIAIFYLVYFALYLSRVDGKFESYFRPRSRSSQRTRTSDMVVKGYCKFDAKSR